MKTTIDAAGRLVTPKAIRRRAGIERGMSLETRWRDGRIKIEPAVAMVQLVRRGRLLVAVPEPQVEELTHVTVEGTRHDLTRERGSQS